MMDDDAVLAAMEERKKIVEKYDKGRQEGAVIDPWEDPEISLLQVVDRFGFVHEKELPSKLASDPDKKNVDKEMKRDMKWLSMLKSWNKFYPKSEKLKDRVYKGIPEKLRGAVWSKLMDLEKTKMEQPGKYQEMREKARNWSPDIRQIDLDVNRTYRDHIMFRQRYDTKQQALFHILAAYSMYNTEVGYCQGMSQVAALLLMYMNEEEAFWALSALMANEKFAMHGFFIPGFPKLIRYQNHHDKILDKLLPKLKKKLQKLGIDTGLYTLKWFFQCFLDRIPFSLTLRVWDVYIFEGERLLVAMAYTILKSHRKTLMNLGMDDTVELLQMGLEKDFGYSDDEAMEQLRRCMEELKRNKLDYPGPCLEGEVPQKPFGLVETPDVEKLIGRRKKELSSAERLTEEVVVKRYNEKVDQTSTSDYHSSNGKHAKGSRLSIESSHSYDMSVDDGSWVACQRSSRSSVDATSAISALSATVGGVLSRSSNGSVISVFPNDVTPGLTPTKKTLDKSLPCLCSSPDSLASDKVRIFVPYSNNNSSGSLNREPTRVVITVEGKRVVSPTKGFRPLRNSHGGETIRETEIM